MKKFLLVAMAVALTCGCTKTNRVTFKDVNVAESEIRIKVAGDNMFHSNILKSGKDEDGEYNFDHLYEHIRGYMSDADITVINQESTIVNDLKRVSGYPSFGVPETICDTLIKSGFDVILQANNHITDKEESGIKSTIEAWEKHPEVAYLGIHPDADDAKRIRFVEVKSVKIGMLNFTYGVNRPDWPLEGQEHYVDIYDEETVADSINRARRVSDLVIVFLHDGAENKKEPAQENKDRVNHCIDSGADIVICAHSHVIHPYEAITTPRGNSGLVYYSLGNFISGQTKIETLLGGVADITLKKETTSDKKTKITITSYGLEPVVTHTVAKENIACVYKLRDYTDELALLSDYGRKNKKTYSVQALWDLYSELVVPESEDVELEIKE